MKIQIINDYLALALENKVPMPKCYNNQHDTGMMCKYDMDSDIIKIECLECTYSITPGLALYQYMEQRVKEHEHSR